MTMQTLQIRIPKKLVEKIDLLIKSGLFRSRSEIFREAVRKYIQESNYNGMIPFIVGPFTAKQIEILKNTSFESLLPPNEVIESIKKELKTLTVE